MPTAKRYKLKIDRFSRYPNEARWNFGITVIDTQHPLFSDSEKQVIGDISIDYSGDIEEFKIRLAQKRDEIINEGTEVAIKAVIKAIEEI